MRVYLQVAAALPTVPNCPITVALAPALYCPPAEQMWQTVPGAVMGSVGCSGVWCGNGISWTGTEEGRDGQICRLLTAHLKLAGAHLLTGQTCYLAVQQADNWGLALRTGTDTEDWH